ncbi:MAG: DUF86 domain-containing protein [Desulfobacterales bacterium]|nr:DUF86 domain-containing protein [Desulfobacterales bacterium]
MKKDSRVYLAQILERIDRIKEFTADGKQAFLNDLRTQDAVIRNFEVIGEAAKRIPEEYRKGQPTIPWRELSGFRDVLIHQYEGVNAAEVWQIVEKNLDPLRRAIVAILPPLNELEKEIAGNKEPDKKVKRKK